MWVTLKNHRKQVSGSTGKYYNWYKDDIARNQQAFLSNNSTTNPTSANIQAKVDNKIDNVSEVVIKTPSVKKGVKKVVKPVDDLGITNKEDSKVVSFSEQLNATSEINKRKTKAVSDQNKVLDKILPKTATINPINDQAMLTPAELSTIPQLQGQTASSPNPEMVYRQKLAKKSVTPKVREGFGEAMYKVGYGAQTAAVPASNAPNMTATIAANQPFNIESENVNRVIQLSNDVQAVKKFKSIFK